MRIISYCRHKTASWEGVIYTTGQGNISVSNGLFEWDCTPSRMSALEMVESINIPYLLEYMNLRPAAKPLAELLQGEPCDFRQDVEYLSRPLIESVAYEITDTCIKIVSPTTCFVHVELGQPLERESLLSKYRQILAMVKTQGIKVSYTAHIKRTLQNQWEDYISAASELEKLFLALTDQARIVQLRGLHQGYSDDKEMSLLCEINAKLQPYGYRTSVTSHMESISHTLSELEQTLSLTPGCCRSVSL